MQTSVKRFGVFTGFVIMLAVLAINAFLLRRQLAVQVQNQAWVAHSRQVMLDLAQTESLLKDAETGQRGFLLTDDAKYLDPYTAASVQLAHRLDRLTALTADNPDEQIRIARVRGLAQAKLDELAQTISLAQSGRKEEAIVVVQSNVGQDVMDDIRVETEAIDQEENRLLDQRMGTYRDSISQTIRAIYLATGLAVLGLVGLAFSILYEITQRERHARQLLQREEWFRVTLTSLGDAVIATDAGGDVTYLNPMAERMIGLTLDRAKGRPITDVFPIFNEQTHQPVDNPVAKVMELGVMVGLANHTVLRNIDGSFTPIEDSAAPIRDAKDNLIGVVLVFRDATLERKTQQVLRNTEKLAAAGRMAATVAHEINNPLESVGNLIFLARGSDGVPAEAIEYLKMAETELDRVSHIARQTLGFYREFRVPELVDVTALIEGVLKLHSNKLAAKAVIVQREFGPCPPVHGLPGELKQAVSNLISNAADAVPNHGTIAIHLQCVEDPQGRSVEIRIEDSGPGIDPQNIDRIFEPFFTTKHDIGTGLGLWVTKEIVVRHHGSIETHAANGLGGAAFHVKLPCDSTPTT